MDTTGRRAKGHNELVMPAYDFDHDLWVSTPCGPWSMMQRLNQRTAAQVKMLKEKRAASLIINTNAVAIV